MALEKSVEQLYHTSGDGYEFIPIPLQSLKRPYEFLLEPDQHPFLISGTRLHGESTLVNDPEPFRVGTVCLPTTPITRGFKRAARATEPIPVYDTIEQALYELEPKALPTQRENATRLFQYLSQDTCALTFRGKNQSGTLSFVDGNLFAAVTNTGCEQLRREPALAAFLALLSYQPLTFDTKPLDHNSPDYVGAGVQALPAAALPAYAYSIRQQLEINGLGSNIFNVRADTFTRLSGPDYAIAVRHKGRAFGLLRFLNGHYFDGELRLPERSLTGDTALRTVLSIAQNVTFERPRQTKEVLALHSVGEPAQQSALATIAHYFAAR
ncbi:hypothetical protein C4580_05935 [Candidatus Woesearchaeota archaeon]|nr:MAG: hypothetical protein C4580_05935 [Candidatus Woesearchaeota archaeon]